ncbi:hypothetical protein TNCV_4006031, partial [Trichonephila clavipes]
MEGLPYCNLYRSKFGDKKIWRPKVGPPRIQPTRAMTKRDKEGQGSPWAVCPRERKDVIFEKLVNGFCIYSKLTGKQLTYGTVIGPTNNQNCQKVDNLN